MLAGLAAVLLVIVIGAEVATRVTRAKQLDSRISALERLVTSNVTYNKALFEGYAGQEEEAAAHFATFARTRAVHRPFIEFRRVPDFHESGINLNGLSYRGPEFSIEKPPNTFRILVYGGSFVWGTGALRDDETLPAHLEKLLSAGQPGPMRYEVINCGETGYNSTQEVIFLIIEGVFLKPDLVIFVDGVNDSCMGYTDLPAGYPKTFDRFNELLTKSLKGRERELFTVDDELEYLKRVRSTLWSSGSSELLRQLRVRMGEAEEARPIDEWQGSLRAEEFAIRHLYNLRTLRGAANEYGFSILTAIQPIPMFHKPMHPDELEAIEALSKYPNHYGMVDWWKRHYLEYTDRVLADAQVQRIPMVDLRRVFEGNASPIYIDDIHVTGEGYRIVAEALHRILLEQKILDFRPSGQSGSDGE